MATTGALTELANISSEQVGKKNALSQEQHTVKLNEALENIAGLKTKLGTYAPKSPEYNSTLEDLSKAIATKNSLFDPANHPGALQRLGEHIGSKLHLIHPELTRHVVSPTAGQPGSTAGQAIGQGEQTPMNLQAMKQAAAAAAGVPDVSAQQLSPEDQQQAARIKARLEPGAAVEKPFNPKDVQWLAGADGVQHPFIVKDGKFEPLLGAEGMAPSAKTTAGKTPWSLYRLPDGSFNKYPVGSADIPAGSILIPPMGLLPQTSTSQFHYADEAGNLHSTPTTRTTSRQLPGTAPATNTVSPASSTGQSLKKKAAATVTSGQPKGDRTIGYKGSQQLKDLQKQQGKATADYNSITTYLRTMKSAADAAKQGSGPAQVNIISSYIKGLIGGQGVRVTQTEWNQAVQTAPWLERVGAHFTPDGYFSHAASPISAPQVDQMIAEVARKQQSVGQERDAIGQQLRQQKASDTGGQETQWKPPIGAPDAKNFPEGYVLHKKGSDEPYAVNQGGQWIQP